MDKGKDMTELNAAPADASRPVWIAVMAGWLLQLVLKALLPLVLQAASAPYWYAAQAAIFIGSAIAGALAARLAPGRPLAVAATTHGLPGPTIFSAGFTVSVPKATAATACAPPTLYTVSTPARRAATSVAESTEPSGVGGVTMASSGTPATTAGTAVIIVTDGKAPLPRGI